MVNHISSTTSKDKHTEDNQDVKQHKTDVCAPLEVSRRHLFPVTEISFKSLDSDSQSANESSSGINTLPTLLGNSFSTGSSVSSGESSFYCPSEIANDGSDDHVFLNGDETSSQDYNTPGELKKCCTDCGRKTSARSMITAKRRGKCDNESCDAFLCRKCRKRWVLMDRHSECQHNKGDKKKEKDWRTAKLKRFCSACYKNVSTIDFNFYSEIIEPTRPDEVSPVTIIFAHREGWSRASFRPHARYLAEKYGYRSILMDYAGHGSRFEEECTVENCVKSVREVLLSNGIPTSKGAEAMGQKTIFASSSWGGIMAQSVMAELQEYFSGVIFDSCCINMESPLERIKQGCWSAIAKRISYYNKLRLLRAWWSLRGHSYVDFIDGNFGAGSFG